MHINLKRLAGVSVLKQLTGFRVRREGGPRRIPGRSKSINVTRLLVRNIQSNFKKILEKYLFLFHISQLLLTCPNTGLFMVFRARWILCGPGETEGVEGAERDGEEEVEGAGGRMDLLVEGPETLIFARPGDSGEEV